MLASPPHLSQHQRTPSPPPLSSSCSSHRSAKLKSSNPCNHRNQQYSIIGLTNAAGTLVERYSYTAYGTLGIYDPNGTVRTTSTYNQRYTYTGREYDADLNLYHFRARWYDPATGAFISRDPLGFVDGRSMYRGYFAAKGLDPRGLYTCECTKSWWAGGPHGGGGGTSTYYQLADDCSTLNSHHNGQFGGQSTTCKPVDRDVKSGYCEAAKKYPKNGWLQCACQTSDDIDWAIAALESYFWGPLAATMIDRGDDFEGKVKWFRCVRICLSEKWRIGVREKETGANGTGSYWPLCWRSCDLNSGDVGCCELQVFAEQTELQDCLGKCGNWKWGNQFPISKIPGWHGDFNDFNRRNEHGVQTCCGSKYYPEHWGETLPPGLTGEPTVIGTTPVQSIPVW